MDKKEISKEQKNLKMRSKINLTKHDPAKTFASVSKRQLALTLAECLLDGDIDSFKEVLGAYISTHNKVAMAKKLKMSRATLYNMLSPEGNPTIDNIAKLLSAI
ncbi:MAG: hypothetical protein WCG27_10985 [Pseudomonadota bacterium]